jgi:hypothetical protein
METIQKLHGVPKIIVSERDPIFTGNYWTEYFLVWLLNWLIDHLTIHNPMGKMRL